VTSSPSSATSPTQWRFTRRHPDFSSRNVLTNEKQLSVWRSAITDYHGANRDKENRMTFLIRLSTRAIALFGLVVGLTVGVPAVALMGLVALPGVLLFAIPARLGYATVDLGRYGVVCFGISETEKAQFKTALALIRRDLRRLRHPFTWPS
jgi:hypothetical protein